VRVLARTAVEAGSPSETADAASIAADLRDMYGDQLIAEAGTAFELAAHMIGDAELAGAAPALFVVSSAIDELHGRLLALPGEILAIEAENRRKAAELEGLRTQAGERTNEIRARYGTVRLFDRLFGVDVEARVASHLAADQRLGSLQKRIDAVETDTAAALARLAGYRSVDEPSVQRFIGKLEAQVGALYEALVPAAGVVSLRAGEDRVARRERLLSALRSGIDLLEEMKLEAKAIGVDLDSVIGVLRGVIDMVEESLRAIGSGSLGGSAVRGRITGQRLEEGDEVVDLLRVEA
jgi:hypothetical protein